MKGQSRAVPVFIGRGSVGGVNITVDIEPAPIFFCEATGFVQAFGSPASNGFVACDEFNKGRGLICLDMLLDGQSHPFHSVICIQKI